MNERIDSSSSTGWAALLGNVNGLPDFLIKAWERKNVDYLRGRTLRELLKEWELAEAYQERWQKKLSSDPRFLLVCVTGVILILILINIGSEWPEYRPACGLVVALALLLSYRKVDQSDKELMKCRNAISSVSHIFYLFESDLTALCPLWKVGPIFECFSPESIRVRLFETAQMLVGFETKMNTARFDRVVSMVHVRALHDMTMNTRLELDRIWNKAHELDLLDPPISLKSLCDKAQEILRKRQPSGWKS